MTNVGDALAAAVLGADALGFIFVKSSPRYIAPAEARNIIRQMPPFVTTVGVFADTALNDVLEIVKKTSLDCVQLHGEEPPEELARYPMPAYKSFHVDSGFHPEVLQRYAGSAYLLDTKVTGKLGGTGQIFNWDIAVEAKKYGRIILAGGLSPENIVEAVQKVRPYAVDVNSGVEDHPGKKDHAKMKLLFDKLNQMENV
ncbi:MAG: phosphoribosylanthranilate isomerase [Ignavibacteriae bacterium]|nr:MAG: phosphoribosylanthranilate isomerase [Ignavibacteriota bacterium]